MKLLNSLVLGPLICNFWEMEKLQNTLLLKKILDVPHCAKQTWNKC